MKGQGFKIAAALLPGDIRAAALALPERVRARAEELRLRAGRRGSVLLPEGERPFTARELDVRDLESVLETATRASAHTALESVRAGFVAVGGGVRLGLSGVVAESEGRVLAIRRLGSMALRIPHEARGCADALFPALCEGGFRDTLLLSTPGGGKTTLLRELVRLLGGSRRVALLDERGEVAGAFDGLPRFEIGERTDVLTGADKRRGAMMMLRAMNPEVLAMDEITDAADVEAVRLAAGCGVRLLATAHAASAAELKRRPLYRALLAEGIFERAVEIARGEGGRSYALRELRA